MDILNFPVVGQNKQRRKVVHFMLTDSSAISYRRALRVKMFRLLFVLALAFLLSSFAKSLNNSSNQVSKLITRPKVIAVESELEWEWEVLCFVRACNFPNNPLIHNTWVHFSFFIKKKFQQSHGTTTKSNCCALQARYCKDGG